MGAATATKKAPNLLREKYLERQDPKHRGVDGVQAWLDIVNRDPTRHYVGVNENTGHFDIEYYESIAGNLGLDPSDGYIVERKRDGGIKLRAGSTQRGNDDILRWRGMVIMSCSLEFKKLTEEVGTDGVSGQRGADALDRMVGRRKSFEDPQSRVVGANGTQYMRPLTQSEMEQG